LLGAEIFALEFASDAGAEEYDGEGTRLTTSDLSFGFAEERDWWGEEEEKK
jgi:hypothetical protein